MLTTSPEQRLPLATGALHIAALWSLVIAQPLFDTYARQPAFFLARPSEPVDIMSLTAVLCLLLPALLALLEFVAYKIDRVLHWRLHLVLVAGILLCLGPQLARLVSLTQTLPVMALSLAVAGVGTWLLATKPAVSSFLSMLAVVALWFPVNFLFLGPISNIVQRRINAGAVSAGVKATAPVVFVVLDEFPLSSLLDANQEIDARRFPNLAALSGESTWYRYASGVCDNTTLAVPSILTGTWPQPDRGPFLVQHPKNLFTWLGGSYELWVSEYITMLSPQGQTVNAKQTFSERFGLLLEDTAIIFGHIALPDALGKRWLPSTEYAWQGFGRRKFEVEGRSQDFRRFIRGLEPGPKPRLHFIHLLLPHYPYVYLPDGHQYDNAGASVCDGLEDNLWQNDWYAQQGYQRHLLQVSFVDKLVGEMVDKMKKSGLYDDALVVVTADHGASFRTGAPHRSITPDNVIDELFVPLIIKAPHQKAGAVSAANASSIDILPTVASLLDSPLPWPVDGHSLVDAQPNSEPKKILANIYRPSSQWANVTQWQEGLEAAVKRYRSLFPEPGPDGLYRIGPLPQYWDKPTAELQPAEPLPQEYELRLPGLLEHVDRSQELLPARISGWAAKIAPGTPLVVAVGDRVAATTMVQPNGTFSVMIEPERLKDGSNTIEIFAYVDGRLHPLPGHQQRTYSLSQGELKTSDGKAFKVAPLESSMLEVVAVDDSRVIIKGWAEVNQAERLVLFWGGRQISWPLSGSGKLQFSEEFPRPSPLPDPSEMHLIVVGDSAGEVKLKEQYKLAPTFEDGVPTH